MDKDTKKLIKEAERQGWRVDVTSKGHPRFWPPNKDQSPIIGSGTSSDHRSFNNLVARLRRAGLRWPPKK